MPCRPARIFTCFWIFFKRPGLISGKGSRIVSEAIVLYKIWPAVCFELFVPALCGLNFLLFLILLVYRNLLSIFALHLMSLNPL